MDYFKDGILSQPSPLREVPSYATNNTGTPRTWSMYMEQEGFREYEQHPPVCTCQGDGACELCRSKDGQ